MSDEQRLFLSLLLRRWHQWSMIGTGCLVVVHVIGFFLERSELWDILKFGALYLVLWYTWKDLYGVSDE